MTVRGRCVAPGAGCPVGSTGPAQQLLTCAGNVWWPRGTRVASRGGPLWTRSGASGQQSFSVHREHLSLHFSHQPWSSVLVRKVSHF